MRSFAEKNWNMIRRPPKAEAILILHAKQWSYSWRKHVFLVDFCLFARVQFVVLICLQQQRTETKAIRSQNSNYKLDEISGPGGIIIIQKVINECESIKSHTTIVVICQNHNVNNKFQKQTKTLGKQSRVYCKQ